MFLSSRTERFHSDSEKQRHFVWSLINAGVKLGTAQTSDKSSSVTLPVRLEQWGFNGHKWTDVVFLRAELQSHRTVGVILGDFPSFVMFSIFILILIGQVLFSGGSLHLFIHVFLFIRIIWCLRFLCHETVVWKMHKWSWSSVLYVKDVHKLVTWRKHGSTGNTLFFNLIHLTYLFIFAAIRKTGRCRITVLWWCLVISCGSGQILARNRNKNELLRRCCCQFK